MPTRGVPCSSECPCFFHADGSLQSDAMPDSRPQDPRIAKLLLDHGANPTDQVDSFGFGGGASSSKANGPVSDVVRGARRKNESRLC